MLSIRPLLESDFAAEICGLDLRVPLEPAAVAEIRATIDHYGVVLFRDQKMDNDQELAFARQLGTLQVSPSNVRKDQVNRIPYSEMSDISNLDGYGEVRKPNDRRRLRSLGNRLWHVDSSYQAPRGEYSMLLAHSVPSQGGETEYADLRAAYDELPIETKRRIENLVAEHSVLHSRIILGFDDFAPEELERHPPVTYPLVWVHPGSKRRTLYLASHASHILGWPVPEGRVFLMELIEFATQRKFVYSHKWRVGDFVIWDNRCTMHRGRAYDDVGEVRDMRRVTTLDLETPLPLDLVAV